MSPRDRYKIYCRHLRLWMRHPTLAAPAGWHLTPVVTHGH